MMAMAAVASLFGLVPLKEMACPKATVALMPQLTVPPPPLSIDVHILKPIQCKYHNLFISQQIVYILH